MQYPYYNGAPFRYDGYEFNMLISERSRMKREIRRLGHCMGGAILLYLALQNIYLIILEASGLSGLFLSSEIFSSGVEVLLIIFSILPAFMFFGIFMKKITGTEDPLVLTKPRSPLLTLLAFFAGMGCCMVANYVSSFFRSFVMIAGYELSSPASGLPGGFIGITLSVVKVVLVAALIEEISFRGYVMGNLKKYGTGFAIFASALIFALMHGNLIQAPFALVVGLALGYFSIRTESIWTGILIHAGNNLFSVIMSYVSEYFGDVVFFKAYIVANAFFLVSGGICFALFQYLTKKDRVRQGDIMTTGEKVKAFLSSPAVIAVIVIMFMVTLNYIAPVEQSGQVL